MKIYEVGGAVRDSLIGLEVNEKDWVVVGSNQSELLNLGYKKIGKDFPVFLHPKTNEEYSLARKEKKVASGYHGFSFDTSPNISLKEDLLRRDLTINAIAKDNLNNIFDPFDGEGDIKKKILRHISPAFKEDPLRVLRVARFAAKLNNHGFKIADETLVLMTEMCNNGEVDSLRPERVWQETEKALSTNRPDIFFKTLKRCNALKIIFPEIEALFGVPQSKESHPEINTGINTMMCLKSAAEMTSDVTIRFATLVHDLGKASTNRKNLTKYDGHEKESVKILNKIFKKFPVPKRYQEIAIAVAKFHGIINKVYDLSATEIIQLIEDIDGIRKPSKLKAITIACEAGHRGREGKEKSKYKQREYLEEIFENIQNVNMIDITSNLKGKELGDAIRKKRIDIITEYLNKNKKN
ncbi:MAG: multifunctional CCA addition/repair protein [Pseudomonadota bacterium]|nr:multifunctional CCA addition/repair protein [Gammaproteobacteria bacterium]MEE2683809.1 multifunctional CCA addition/repair protein [Pseudomonadota bacterium]